MVTKVLFSCLLGLSWCQIGFGQSDTTQPTQQLTLLFAGDIMGHADQIAAAAIVPDSLYDYRACFAAVAPLLQSADLAIGNLELTLPGTPPYTGYPSFKSPDALADALALAGFDLLFTANNHSADAGSKGIVHTIEALEKRSLFQTGTFRDTLEREWFYPLVVYRKGFKLAFLNYTYGTNGVQVKPPHVVNMIDPDQIARDIARAKALQPDMVIAMMHWGDEYQTHFNRSQEELAIQMMEQGVDLIVGSHPHVVQPIRWYKRMEGNRERKALVAYSLGNFISGQTIPNTDGGMLLKVVLSKDSTTTTISESDYLPVWRYKGRSADMGKTVFEVLPIPVEGEVPDNDRGSAAQQAMERYRRHVKQVMEKSDITPRSTLN